MDKSLPPDDTFTKLLEASAEFLQARCWEWMHDTDIFGVQSPDNGEIGYCCVMGNAGELFGLGFYLGTAGLLGYEMVATGVLRPGDSEALSYQRCLMVDFEDRGALQPNELELIKRSGLKFRGRKSWPTFTSYRPGYVPWELTVEEARFLTIAIHQALSVALRFKDDKSLLDSPDPGEVFFVRVPEEGIGGTTWTDAWRAPDALDVEDYALDSLEEIRLKRIAKRISSRSGTFEIDVFLGPALMGDTPGLEERPFYANVFLCVDQASSFILDSYLARPADGFAIFRTRFIQLLETHQFVPETILVCKRKVFELFQPAAELLGVGLSLTNSLPAADQAQDALMGFSETEQE